MRGRRWTEAEEATLAQLYNDWDLSVFDIADKMDRSFNAITSRAYKLGLVKNPKYVYTKRRKGPALLDKRSGRCYGRDFTAECVDNCDRWVRCLDAFVDNVVGGAEYE